MVFDGTVDVEAEAEGRRLGVTVLYAPGRRNAADDVIARLVGEDDDPATLTVVTSDQELTRRVRSAGARVLGAGAFRRALDDAPDAPRP